MKTDPRFPKLHIVDHPLVQHKLSTMREKKTPSNSFRQLLRELTYLIGYEVTRDLPLETRTIDTPLCKCKGNTLISCPPNSKAVASFCVTRCWLPVTLRSQLSIHCLSAA